MADKNTNVRRIIADGIFNPLLDGAGVTVGEDQANVARDPRNPYAALVTVGTRTFRVIVKEVE